MKLEIRFTPCVALKFVEILYILGMTMSHIKNSKLLNGIKN